MDAIIVFCAKYLIIFVGLLLIWLWFKAPVKIKKKIALQVVIAGIIGIVLIKIAGKLYYHPRPFVDGHVKPLFPHSNDNGFPSDHTALAMTLTAVIYYYDKQIAFIAFVLTLATGIARVLANVHSPVDILGGLLIGAASGWAGWWIAQRLWAIYKKDKAAKKL